MKKEFKGTKGRWERITANWDLDQCVFVEDTEQEICTIKSESHNQMYDAQLIAHAPDMLEKHIEEIEIIEDILKNNPIGETAFKLRMIIESKKELINLATNINI